MPARFRSFFSRMAAFFRRGKLDGRLRDELQLHAELLAEEHMRHGMAAEEARRRARVELGGLEQLGEEYRDARGLRWVEDLAQDARYALRQFRRSPGFTVIALLIIAIGIGGATAIFSFVDAAMLKPFAYRDPDHLVAIRGERGRQIGAAIDDILTFKRESRALADVAAAGLFADSMNLTGSSLEYAQRTWVGQLTANYFDVLGVVPQPGRSFLPEENQPGRESVAILSNGLWKGAFGADPNIVGKKVFLNGRTFEVVGVLPRGALDTPSGDPNQRIADLWVPLPFTPATLKNGLWAQVIGRVKPGVTLPQAADDTVRVFSAHDWLPKKEKPTVLSLRDSIVAAKTRTILLLLWGASAFVLLIACTNLASLILARDSARRHEVAIRASLGAGRFRLMRQFLSEIVLLSAIGGLLGVLLSIGLTRAIRATQPLRFMPAGTEASFDFRIFLFGFGLALLTGLAFGVVPAWRISAGRSRAAVVGRAGYFEQTSPARRRGFGAVMIVTEIALAFVLLIGSALMVRSFVRLMSVDIGFRTGNIITGSVQLPQSRYPGAAEIRAYQEQLLERLRANPAFRSVALTNAVPLGGGAFDGPITVHGQKKGAMFFQVTPEYQRIMGLRLLRGRWLSILDGPSAPPVLVVSERFARLYLAGQEPIGQTISSTWGLGEQEWTIVGVVAPVKYTGLDQKDDARGWNEIYVPIAQLPPKRAAMRNFAFLAETSSDSKAAIPAIRSIAASIDRDLALSDVKSMDKVVADSVAMPRFQTWVFAGFGIVALLLTSLGVYGVLAYSVSQRTREIGVRMALGAQTRDVAAMVVRQGGLLVLIGVAIGCAAALALSKILTSLLFEITPRDPLAFIVAAIMILGVALLACYLPARRAARVDPLVALRCE